MIRLIIYNLEKKMKTLTALQMIKKAALLLGTMYYKDGSYAVYVRDTIK